MAKKRITPRVIADVYKSKGCNVSATCEALGISRTTFYRRKNKSKKLQDLLDEVDESLLDFAESKLMQHITNGSETSLIFFLKTKGRKRGYIERVEQEVTVNPFLELMKSLPDNPEEE